MDVLKILNHHDPSLSHQFSYTFFLIKRATAVIIISQQDLFVSHWSSGLVIFEMDNLVTLDNLYQWKQRHLLLDANAETTL